MMKYMLAVLFLGLSISGSAFANINPSPEGLAGSFSDASSCLMSTLFRMGVALIPAGVVFLLVSKFIQIERKKETGEVYTDEIVSILIMSILIALSFHLLFTAYTFFGIPVKEIIHEGFYCYDYSNSEGSDKEVKVNCKSLDDVHIPKQCSKNIEAMGFSLKMSIGLSRLFVISAPMLVLLFLVGKSLAKHANAYKRNEYSMEYAGVRVLIDTTFATIAVSSIATIVLSFFYLDHGKLVAWFFDLVSKLNK